MRFSLRLPTTALTLLLTTASFTLPREAHAVLGQNEASVTTVVDALRATGHEIDAAEEGVTRHRIRSAGLEVREYVSEKTGQVVGIVWEGSREPRRIDAILGTLMTEYVRGIRTAQSEGTRLPSVGNHRGARILSPVTRAHSEHLVIERYSRMGLSRGRIYLAELPSGVNVDAIR